MLLSSLLFVEPSSTSNYSTSNYSTNNYSTNNYSTSNYTAGSSYSNAYSNNSVDSDKLETRAFAASVLENTEDGIEESQTTHVTLSALERSIIDELNAARRDPTGDFF